MEINATGRQRTNFAVQHMIAAARFARLCYKVEDDNAGAPFGPFYDEIISYVTATILSTVASLEANINEIFADVLDNIIVFDGLDINILTEVWDLIEGKSILKKYQLIKSCSNLVFVIVLFCMGCCLRLKFKFQFS